MAVTKKEREPLILKENNCELFSVSIEVEEKSFLRELFIKTLPLETLAESLKRRHHLTVSCNRRNKKIDYRASVDIHPGREKAKVPKIHFHVSLTPTATGPTKDEQSPYAEEIFQWLHNFILSDAAIALSEQAEFAFPLTAYRSVFSIPSQLVGPTNQTGNETFEGSQMVGVSINLQGNSNKAGVHLAEQRILKKSIAVRLIRRTASDAQKLMTIENDVPILREIALLTVRPIRRKK